MHLTHLIWIVARFVGQFHALATALICVLLVVCCGLIYLFYNIFKRDLLSDSEER